MAKNSNLRPRLVAALLGVSLALSGCAARGSDSHAEGNDSGASPRTEAQSTAQTPPAHAPAAPDGEAPDAAGTVDTDTDSYIERLVQEAVAQFYQPGMSEFERTKGAFDYMLETASLVDPVGLELWQVRGDYDQPPGFVENRSLSILLFGVGKCEDYAAALTMLLRGAGLEARYVPGLTYSTQGELVDHAWTVVRVEGAWYHVDCQLEQNISRHGSTRYKYFMRSDATMAGSHRWGENLIGARLLTAEQNEEIARDWTPPACPADYPTPERHSFDFPGLPDLPAIRAAVDEEMRAYERLNGALPWAQSNTIPPVFGLEGYGPGE